MDENTPGALFDEHGLFVGDIGQQMWSRLCLEVEDDLDREGWDLPARLLAVSNPVHTEAHTDPDRLAAVRERARGNVAAGAPADADLVLDGIPFAVTVIGDVPGLPTDTLWGETAPPWADALVLAFESWMVPPLFDDDGRRLPDPHEHLRNSQHPRRVEMRQVLMMTRGGAQYAVTRERGSAAEVVEPMVGGLLVEVLQRMLELPTAPPETTTADLLGRMALAAAVRALEQMAEPGTPSPNAAATAANDQIQAALTELSDADRTELLAAAFTKALLSAVAHVAWKATNHGELGIPSPLRRVVRDVAYKGTHDPTHLDAVAVAAEAASGLSFTELVAGKRAAELLPGDVVAAPAGWADEGLLARRLCWRQWPSQAQLWDRVVELVGERPKVAVAMLEGLGWASDAPAGPVGAPGA